MSRDSKTGRRSGVVWCKHTRSEESFKATYVRRYDRSGSYCITECKSKSGFPTVYLAESVVSGERRLLSRHYSFPRAKLAVAKHARSLHRHAS